MKQRILDLLQQQGDLPPFPDILTRLQKKLSDPDSGIPEIAQLISFDPALSGNILKLANSAYYSTGGAKVNSLSIAISKLGLKKIKHLVYSLELTKLFTGSTIVDYYSFWRHSLAVALFTQKLSRYTDIPPDMIDSAYMCGLMHDVGVMVMCYLIPKEYKTFIDSTGEEETPLYIQEQEHFGIDHQEAGSLFIEKWWQADAVIINAVRYHHLPFSSPENVRTLAGLLNVANGICNTNGYTTGINCYHEVFNEGAWEQLGLSLSDVEPLLSDVNNAVEQAGHLLGYVG